MSDGKEDARELKATAAPTMPAPDLIYQPPVPLTYRPPIALIGCGGIARNHLDAYRGKDYPVVALCDTNLAAAIALRDEFFPDAAVTDDADEIFARADIEVVDLVLHPGPRLALMRRALEADKHVLSQKPFVTDIREGRKLVELAEQRGRKLAVNQNGRWAPYFSYLRQAVKQGLLGEIVSCDIHIAWDHTWIKDTRFEHIHHIVLYDFAIHWFDIVTSVFGERRPTQVFATVGSRGGTGPRAAPERGRHGELRCGHGLAGFPCGHPLLPLREHGGHRDQRHVPQQRAGLRERPGDSNHRRRPGGDPAVRFMVQ